MITHQMHLEDLDDHGRETWQCDECPYRFACTRRPFSREVLVAGDNVVHAGSYVTAPEHPSGLAAVWRAALAELSME